MGAEGDTCHLDARLPLALTRKQTRRRKFHSFAMRSHRTLLVAFFLAHAIWRAMAAQEFPRVPGVVIAHSPASSGIYIGSPSLVVLPDGRYVATHDEFGPESTENSQGVTRVFRSADSGRTWKKISTITGQY